MQTCIVNVSHIRQERIKLLEVKCTNVSDLPLYAVYVLEYFANAIEKGNATYIVLRE